MDELTVSGLGESRLLEVISEALGPDAPDLSDDCALTAAPALGERTVWTMDTMSEGAHFRWWRELEAEPELLGRKLAAVNLSDLASKGASPRYALISLGIPKTAAVDRVRRFYTGLGEALRIAGAALIGGDTVAAERWSLTLTLTGSLAEGLPPPVRRNAVPGEFVYTSGHLGGARAGLEILEGHWEPDSPKIRQALIKSHLSPQPRNELGQSLVRLRAASAMMDISDGLAQDAARLAKASALRIEIDGDRLPLSPELLSAGRDAMGYALRGGEDYELLWCSAFSPEELRSKLPSFDLHPIGRTLPGEGVYLSGKGGGETHLIDQHTGFDHFRAPDSQSH